MGGVQTSARDYARWVAFLLSAWPPRDGADAGPVKRATVRELAQGLGFPRSRIRPGRGGERCRQAVTYGMGFQVAQDCDVGLTLSHSGGYPGFGSHVLLLPDRGVGIFAFANRTYGAPVAPVWDTAIALAQQGRLPAERPVATSPELAQAYRVAGTIYTSGEVTRSQPALAMNFLMDRDAAGWARDLASLKARAGACNTQAPIQAQSALDGQFLWSCEHGEVRGSLLLSPTLPPRIQSLQFQTLER